MVAGTSGSDVVADRSGDGHGQRPAPRRRAGRLRRRREPRRPGRAARLGDRPGRRGADDREPDRARRGARSRPACGRSPSRPATASWSSWARFPDTASVSIPTAITDGSLAGFAVQPLPDVAVAGRAGVTFVQATVAQKASLVATAAPVTGMANVTGIGSPSIYMAETDKTVTQLSIDDPTSATITPPSLQTSLPMPGQVSKVAFDAATKMVQVLGRTPDGSAETVYVVEPQANGGTPGATYADAQLPFTSVAWAMDATHDYPSTDREALLVASADGTIASIDVGGDPVRLALPGRGRRRADRAASSTCSRGSCSSAARSRSWPGSWSRSTGCSSSSPGSR